jgi:3-hydroxyisobutyrate dehydrogenase/2-hydroxy-3-oxopropionate reductase
MAKTAFIGLGVMGFPMAGHLSAAGHSVVVYNRNTVKAEDWVARHGGAAVPTPAAAAEGAEFVFSCVGNDDDVRSIALGDSGVLASLAPDAVFVDHTTASATLARELDSAAAAKGCRFLDAPVSGGQQGAENGQLSIMIGGEEAAFEAARPVMDAYAKAMILVGPAGSGQLTKMVNQICLAGLTQGLAEALAFAARSGADTEKILAAISKGAAQSWMMDHRAETMLDDRFDFGFAVDWLRKDLGIALEEARRSGASLPVTALVDQFLGAIQKRQGGRWDITSLIRLVR